MRRLVQIVLSAGLLLHLLLTTASAQETSVATAASEPRAFMRLVENEDGGFLQVLVATYQRLDATVTLFGCVHVADRQFYEGMQQRFEACDALLYELIAEADLRPYPDMPRGDDHWITMVQDGMGSGLLLHEQFECMDYRMDNFVHADMTDEERTPNAIAFTVAGVVVLAAAGLALAPRPAAPLLDSRDHAGQD